MSPEHTLIVYGTLAPGEVNHEVLAPLRGEWKKGKIFGQLKSIGWGADLGFPGFVRSDDPEPIDVHIFCSEQLSDYWSKLDSFEGEEYHRTLEPFELEDGQTGLGYIYILREA